MKIAVKSRTKNHDYWWHEIGPDGSVVPVAKSSAFDAGEGRYAAYAYVGLQEVVAMVIGGHETVGLMLANIPTGDCDERGRLIVLDLLIQSESREEIRALTTQLVRIWPPDNPSLLELCADATAAGIDVLEWRIAEPLTTARRPDTQHAGRPLRRHLEEVAQESCTFIAKARPFEGHRLVAVASPERIDEMVSWLRLDQPGVEAIVVSANQEIEPKSSWSNITYILTNHYKPDWVALGLGTARMGREENEVSEVVVPVTRQSSKVPKLLLGVSAAIIALFMWVIGHGKRDRSH